MVEGVPMTLGFNRSSTGWSLKLCKHATEKEVGLIAEHLRRRGYNPSVSKSAVAGIVKYYLVTLGAKDVAKLAQSDAEVLKAVIKLAERKGVKREEVLKRLGVAESPPLLNKASAVKLTARKATGRMFIKRKKKKFWI